MLSPSHHSAFLLCGDANISALELLLYEPVVFFFAEWNVSEFGELSFPGHIISELHIMANRIFDFWVFDEVEQKGWFLSFAFKQAKKKGIDENFL